MDTADLRTVHAIPGRIRVKVGALKDNAALARELEERLAAEPGVRRAEANPTTGSLLEAHHVIGFFRGLNEQVRSATGGPGLTVLVPLALLLLGARGLMAAEEVAVPRWYDLVWFGFATFLMLNAAGVPAAKAAEEAAEVAAAV
ncbi:MAG: hypothetical protein E6J83_13420 [Deltaproteobacteria bacterium]|nr:MAG: hypothetical protein E6J83_13420 [Deltaproteobacteria bacterium]